MTEAEYIDAFTRLAINARFDGFPENRTDEWKRTGDLRALTPHLHQQNLQSDVAELVSRQQAAASSWAAFNGGNLQPQPTPMNDMAAIERQWRRKGASHG